jgi:hypothetical protein
MKNKIALGIIILTVVATIFAVASSVSAYDNDQTYNANATYFVEEEIGALHGNTATTSIWVNTSVALGDGSVIFTYESSCANVTDFVGNATNWNTFCATNLQSGNVKIVLGNSYPAGVGPGLVHIGDITVECINENYCVTNLAWDANPSQSYLNDVDGDPIQNVNWVNGTFACEAPVPEVVINEFSCYNTSDDWVELYNKGTSKVLLDSWSINDSDSEIYAFQAGENISAGGYLVVDVDDRLNRNDDTITLLNGSEIVDQVTYGSGEEMAPAPGEGNSTGRYPNGVDTDNDADDFVEFDTPTSGEPNVISKVVISIGTVVGDMTAPIRIDNASNIGCADINITYNSSVCVITEVTNGSFDITFANLEQNETGWVRIGAFQTENPGLNGGSIILAYLKFRGNSTSGTSPLNLTVNTLTDATNETNDIPYIIVNGTFLTFLNGDVNGDGEVALSDAMYLAKHILDITGFEDIVEAAADVNGDGEVALSDAMYLAKHILDIPGFEELK